MQIVGSESSDQDGGGHQVHTIDIWFSARRRAWMVERLDADGNQIGAAYRCASEQEAASCLADWLRAHDEAYLVAPFQASAAEKRLLTESRQAA